MQMKENACKLTGMCFQLNEFRASRRAQPDRILCKHSHKQLALFLQILNAMVQGGRLDGGRFGPCCRLRSPPFDYIPGELGSSGVGRRSPLNRHALAGDVEDLKLRGR